MFVHDTSTIEEEGHNNDVSIQNMNLLSDCFVKDISTNLDKCEVFRFNQ